MNNPLENHIITKEYSELEHIKDHENITLLKRNSDGRLFVRKEFSAYNVRVLQCLMENPVENMPRIESIAVNGNTVTLIEEYLEGTTLTDLFQIHKSFHETYVKEFLCKLCDILSELHELARPRIVHRDIKPSNIIISPDGAVKLLDINASKFENLSRMQDTVMMGTRGFAAPEQYGFGVSTVQTDIYAVGVLANYMLTGEIYGRHYLSCSLSPVIRKCLKLQAEDRFSSAAELKDAIEHTVYGDYYKEPEPELFGPESFYDEYYCKNCDAILNEQPGFDPRDPAWKCRVCGDICTNALADAGKYKYPDMVWFCDRCNAFLSIQQNFRDDCGTWCCAECGYKNRIH